MGGGFRHRYDVQDCTELNCNANTNAQEYDEYGLYDYDDSAVSSETGNNNVLVEDWSNDTKIDPKVQKRGGGVTNNEAWIYNGKTWELIAPMSKPRDRPACSLVNMGNGKVWKD